jgi:hypothetical protein
VLHREGRSHTFPIGDLPEIRTPRLTVSETGALSNELGGHELVAFQLPMTAHILRWILGSAFELT